MRRRAIYALKTKVDPDEVVDPVADTESVEADDEPGPEPFIESHKKKRGRPKKWQR